MSQVISLVSTSFIVISAILMAFCWRFIRRGQRERHRKTMIAAATCALLFFILYLTRTIVFGNMPFGGPDSVKPVYLAFLLVHIVLATLSAVLGIVTLSRALKQRFDKHKRIARPTAVIWFVTAATGVTTYLLLNVIYPSQEKTNLWNAIFG